MNYAGFWRRFGAGFMDFMSLNAINNIFFWIYGLIGFYYPLPSEYSGIAALFYIICIPMLSSWLYFAWFQSSKFQATPGMMVFSMYIKNYEGRPISFWRASLRWFSTFLSLLTLGIGYFIMAFTPRKQALHDYIAKTLVIKGFSLFENRSDKIKYAGFWKRFGAGAVDALIANLVIFSLVFSIIIIGNIKVNWQDFVNLLKAENLKDIKILGALTAGSMLFNWIYFACFQSSKYQATPGMRMISMHITDYEGKRISFWRASGRFFFSALSGFIFYGGHLMMAFTPRKQALHDYIAKTLVVRN